MGFWENKVPNWVTVKADYRVRASPTFCLRKTGAVMPQPSSAAEKPSHGYPKHHLPD
jgi:hypothetical protein